MPLTPGTRFGPYDIVALIGVGGMGKVYKARDPRLDREVAIKVLPAELTLKTEMVQRFQREARAIAAVNHPSIVTIYSVEQADGVHFLTMELVEGQSLDRLIPASGLEVERILAIADGLSGALAAAHEKSIVHRDLKPANIMVTDGGAVKVLDFGLAKLHGPPSDQTPDADLPTVMHTSVGVVMGTLPYMSPEQVQGRPLDHRTDIFSLGVVLYEMATGRRPFLEQSSAALSAQILRDAPLPLNDVRAELPDELSRVVQRCLEKDPERRIQTAG
jgi:serine/threonine protein kinase